MERYVNVKLHLHFVQASPRSRELFPRLFEILLLGILAAAANRFRYATVIRKTYRPSKKLHIRMRGERRGGGDGMVKGGHRLDCLSAGKIVR